MHYSVCKPSQARVKLFLTNSVCQTESTTRVYTCDLYFLFLIHFRDQNKHATTEKSSTEDIARRFSRTRRTIPQDIPPRQETDEELARQFSKKRSDIARGKKLVLVDKESESEDEEVEVAKAVKEQVKRSMKKNLAQEELFDIFYGMEFFGTRYPQP